MKSDIEKVNYLIGRQIAGNLAHQGIEIFKESLVDGLTSAINGDASLISDEDAAQLMANLEATIRSHMQKEQELMSAANREAGEDFLKENSQKPGVLVTPSGLQYRVITEGTGALPKATDTVETHYEGTLIDGEVFDSSIRRGESISFPVNGVIKGWQEALQMMSEGSKWEVYIPYNLAYGEQGSPPKIGPFSALVFQIELIRIV